MSIRCELPAGADLEAAARAFDETINLDALLGEGEGEGRAPIAFGRLYAYATEAEGIGDPELAEALAGDPGLRAALRRLVEKTAILRLPWVAAASAGTIMSRDGEGCRIRFQRSRAEPRQTYVIIELDGAADARHRTLFACDPENRCAKFPLPEAREGVVQMLVDEDSELLRALLDIKTEIFIR